ncbi:MAG: heavy metal translocating P-type ATPase [Clostridia bacterium]|nr:heavy metal translocating P-type ATPase [Clostridia bacterium]
MKRTYAINNLDCAHCAAKLEAALKQVEGIESVSVNFVAKKLTIEADESDFDAVMRRALRTCKRIEPDCAVAYSEPARETKHSAVIIRICVAAALFAGALFVPDTWTLRPLCFLIPYAVAGYDVLWRAARNILRGKVFDENFLMALATIVACCIGEYPEAVAVMVFYQIGELFQRVAVGNSRKSIKALMELKPDFARVLRGGAEAEVAPEDVEVGDIILVLPGERIPLDGVISAGSTSLNTAALTGESLPRDCNEGDGVCSGSVNLTSPIRVRVTSPYDRSTVARILELVENSSSNKSRTESFITRFARYYTPCVVIGAALLAVIPPLAFGLDWSEWIDRALTFLVISCPCALVISVPLTFFGGIGGASKRGILIKSANNLEALAHVGTVAFDKTGTLTCGSFRVTAIHPEAMSEAELLDIAVLAESYSKHPIADSILRAHGGHIDSSRIADVSEAAGHGVRAAIDGRTVYVGNGKLMDSAGITWRGCEDDVGTVIHIAADGEYCGHIVISDEVKPDAADTIMQLKSAGVARIAMLTGDVSSVGDAVGTALGIGEVHSSLLPEQKSEVLDKLLSEKPTGTTLAFVGDGINDAPVLARADVGVAMGAMGSDAAIEAADVVLMEDKPSKLPEAMQIAKRTLSIAHQNIAFALAAKLAVLALGALGLADMWMAVFADVGVSVIAILNAMRTLNTKRTLNDASAASQPGAAAI